MFSVSWGFGGCFSVDQFRLLPEAWGLCDCDDMMIYSRSFKPNHGDVISMFYDMIVFTVCYCFPVSMCEVEVYVFELPDLTIFESRSVIFDNHF